MRMRRTLLRTGAARFFYVKPFYLIHPLMTLNRRDGPEYKNLSSQYENRRARRRSIRELPKKNRVVERAKPRGSFLNHKSPKASYEVSGSSFKILSLVGRAIELIEHFGRSNNGYNGRASPRR